MSTIVKRLALIIVRLCLNIENKYNFFFVLKGQMINVNETSLPILY